MISSSRISLTPKQPALAIISLLFRVGYTRLLTYPGNDNSILNKSQHHTKRRQQIRAKHIHLLISTW